MKQYPDIYIPPSLQKIIDETPFPRKGRNLWLLPIFVFLTAFILIILLKNLYYIFGALFIGILISWFQKILKHGKTKRVLKQRLSLLKDYKENISIPNKSSNAPQGRHEEK